MKILVNLYIGFSQKFCIPKQSNKQKIHNQPKPLPSPKCSKLKVGLCRQISCSSKEEKRFNY